MFLVVTRFVTILFSNSNFSLLRLKFLPVHILLFSSVTEILPYILFCSENVACIITLLQSHLKMRADNYMLSKLQS